MAYHLFYNPLEKKKNYKYIGKW